MLMVDVGFVSDAPDGGPNVNGAGLAPVAAVVDCSVALVPFVVAVDVLEVEGASAGGAGVIAFAGAAGAGAFSCLTFSLSFAIAAASKSCFSHFEYDFECRSIFGPSWGLVDCSVDIRRLGTDCMGCKGFTRRPFAALTDCLEPLRDIMSLGAVDSHSKFLPLVGVS